MPGCGDEITDHGCSVGLGDGCASLNDSSALTSTEGRRPL